MRTEVLAIDPRSPDEAALRRAAAVLAAGGLVAFPTETVYGLGARADRPDAVAKIFAAKGRPATNPLIVHAASLDEARALSAGFGPAAETLARAGWPGPLTLVVPRDPRRVPAVISAGRDTVALRVPSHPLTLRLLREAALPVAAPSANRYQSLSPTTAEHVLEGLDGRVDLVLDGGPCTYGIESSVVDTTVDPPVLLRPGAFSWASLVALVPTIEAHRGPAPEGAAPSPGMAARHYAPRASLRVVARERLDEARAHAPQPCAVVRRGGANGDDLRALPDDPEGYAAGLFATLHALDREGYASVLVEAPPDDPAWDAVRDRLARGATDAPAAR